MPLRKRQFFGRRPKAVSNKEYLSFPQTPYRRIHWGPGADQLQKRAPTWETSTCWWYRPEPEDRNYERVDSIREGLDLEQQDILWVVLKRPPADIPKEERTGDMMPIFPSPGEPLILSNPLTGEGSRILVDMISIARNSKSGVAIITKIDFPKQKEDLGRQTEVDEMSRRDVSTY